MAHTAPEDMPEPAGIIQQKPPPPPVRREGDPDREPSLPDTQEQQPALPPLEAPPTQPIAPRVAEAHGPSRRQRRPPSGHVIIPARECDPEIISRNGTRPRMDSAPALTLIDYPRLHKPSLTRLERTSVTSLVGR